MQIGRKYVFPVGVCLGTVAFVPAAFPVGFRRIPLMRTV